MTIRVTVLGCGAAFPRAGGACSGYLVQGGGATVWVDAGNGTFSNLQKHLSWEDVHALVLSHSHADHIADVLPLMYARGFDDVPDDPLPVYAPPDVAPIVSAPLGEGSLDIFERVFAFAGLAEPIEIKDMRIESFRTVHPVETYGVRISDGRATVVYTADTADFPELADACRDADLLLCESTFVRPTTGPPGLHLWADEAGAMAAKADARRLVLVHVWGTIDPAAAVEEAKAGYHGPIEAAVEGRVYEV